MISKQVKMRSRLKVSGKKRQIIELIKDKTIRPALNRKQ
jgi:hypothetical protein